MPALILRNPCHPHASTSPPHQNLLHLPSMEGFYVMQAGRDLGPLRKVDVLRLLQTREIFLTDFYLAPGRNDWTPLSTLLLPPSPLTTIPPPLPASPAPVHRPLPPFVIAATILGAAIAILLVCFLLYLTFCAIF